MSETDAPVLNTPSTPTPAESAEVSASDPSTPTPSSEFALDENGLTLKQEKFCQLYATDREFFGNGTQAYIEAYDPDTKKPNWYKTAQASASRLLSYVKVCKRINDLLEADGLNDQFVDKQLLFLITQHDDKTAKNMAIREYNKLKGRIIEHLDHTSKGKQVVGFTYIAPENPITKPVENNSPE